MKSVKQSGTETSSSQDSPSQDRQLNWLKCPVCRHDVYQSYEISKKSWGVCYCGCVFHPYKRTFVEPSEEEMAEKFKDVKGYNNRVEHFFRLYLPLIEEVTYGRQALVIGNNIPGFKDKLKERGWITQNINGQNFNQHDFNVKRYYLITFNSILEGIDNPVYALKKAHKLLYPSGLILITTGDTEILKLLNHPGEWGRWDAERYRVFFSRTQLVKVLNKIGFETILNRLNMDERLIETHEMHLIAQKENWETGEEQQPIKAKEKTDGQKNTS